MNGLSGRTRRSRGSCSQPISFELILVSESTDRYRAEVKRGQHTGQFFGVLVVFVAPTISADEGTGLCVA